jgi:hypothetical protein
MELKDAREIELSDKPLFDKQFELMQPQISEFTFTNLFIWRNYYNYLLKEHDDHILVFSNEFLQMWNKSPVNNQNAIFSLPPIGPHPEEIIIKLFQEKNIEFHRVPYDIVQAVRNHNQFSQLNLQVIEDRNNWDYVYEKDQLLELPGNKFRQKRRWLTKFFDEYNYDFKKIACDLIDKTLKLQLEWCNANECQSNEDLVEEQKAIEHALHNFKELGLLGGILFVDGKCVAYTLGEILNDNTLVIHIEKAHIEYEGSYQAINNLFLKEFGDRLNYVNREQDLGIEGLRKAKNAYKPDHMIEKSIIIKGQK